MVFARATIRRAARKLLVTAEFPFGPIAARRVGPLLTVAVPRRVRPLLSTIPRCIGLLVAEFLVREARGRTGIATVGARRAVVATEIRTIATRRIGALFAARAIFAVEARLFSVVA